MSSFRYEISKTRRGKPVVLRRIVLRGDRSQREREGLTLNAYRVIRWRDDKTREEGYPFASICIHGRYRFFSFHPRWTRTTGWWEPRGTRAQTVSSHCRRTSATQTEYPNGRSRNLDTVFTWIPRNPRVDSIDIHDRGNRTIHGDGYSYYLPIDSNYFFPLDFSSPRRKTLCNQFPL